MHKHYNVSGLTKYLTGIAKSSQKVSNYGNYITQLIKIHCKLAQNRTHRNVAFSFSFQFFCYEPSLRASFLCRTECDQLLSTF